MPGEIREGLATIVTVFEAGLIDEFLRRGHPGISEEPQCRTGKAGENVHAQVPGHLIERVE